ncbi:recombinase family protein [Nocardia wallacei]|uniref:recombinase family protein n=1 Tax=Nocardia wallacei TaxID=480035 RepID=UPI002454CBE6|nr:recombinase family protein [Nocardia wallacei]
MTDSTLETIKGSGQFQPKIAVSYPRVSTKEQAERDGDPDGYSLPAQREANRRKATSLGAIVVKEFPEKLSGKHAESRPALQEMLAYIKEHHVDYVIVHKVDRLARNRLDDAQIHFAIREAGAELVSATENIDESPSGMLLHGIMSSIAEFYSRNLATEVNKGMQQKARTGGTPGKAPLGYLNVRIINSEGAEVRSVTVDPERGSLIAWAFAEYATGRWTLNNLAAELEARGLTTRPTPKLPGRPIRANSLHKILRTPYYMGEVVFKGVRYPGRHTPLVDTNTWQQVQDVLNSHAVGEKQREHPHYLKSSVFCGGCGMRLIITNAKNRYGTVYPYFICLGRHQKYNDCQRQAVLISRVETLVEAEYSNIQLSTELRKPIEDGLRKELESTRKLAEVQQRDFMIQKKRLLDQRGRLLQAHYAGALPLDLLKEEQDRIARQLAEVEARLESTNAALQTVERNLKAALDYATNCYAMYRNATPHMRRLLNQAFFTKIYVEQDYVRVDLAEPFDALLDESLIATASAEDQAQGSTTEDDHTVTPEGVELMHVIRQTAAETPAPYRSVGNKKPTAVAVGLNETTLVHNVR